jgi:phosphonoacetaldehyde hydrolase
MTRAIKAVVFDWAGTMVDFGCLAPVEALISAYAAEGVALDAATARADMGRAKRDHVRSLMATPVVAEAWAAAKGAAPSEADGERLFAALEPMMVRAAATFSTMIPGAARLAAELAASGVKIGSCTGYTRTMMEAVLPRAADQGYLPATVVCAGETPSGRPSPLMLWQALVNLDAWPAGACVKVDHAEVGIGEGRAAGCWTIGVAASGNGVGLGLDDYQALPQEARQARVAAAAVSLTAAGADFVVDTVADVRPALAEIEARIAAGRGPGDT